MSWIQLSQALLEATGDPVYADMIERAVWNHAFASQTSDGDGFRYGVPLAGWKPELYFTGPNCCSASGPRMLGLLPGMIYGRAKDTLYANQFIPSTVRVQFDSEAPVDVTQRTGYPTDERVSFEFRPPRAMEFEFKVRIPSWCPNPKLSLNGRTVAGIRPGTYASIRRFWKP